MQEARGETVRVSNPRGHSTRTLHQEDSVCHLLWTTDLWLFNLGRPRQFETPHIQEAQEETVRVSNVREHSTKTLNQGDSVCHILWTTALCLFNLGYPRTSNHKQGDSVCNILWTTDLCLFNFEPPTCASRVDTWELSTMGIVIDIPYGPQLCVPSGDNRKHKISPHDSYFHVDKHVNRQHGPSHVLNFPQSQTTNYKVRTGTST